MRALMTVGLGLAFGCGVLMAQGPAPAAPAVPTVVKVGDMAPDFSLQGTDGKTHKLSEYRGKTTVVIAWFPKAFTGGCTIECKSLADNGDKIKKYDVTYFMASTDPIEENIKFAKATTVTLSGRDGTKTVVEKKEADFRCCRIRRWRPRARMASSPVNARPRCAGRSTSTSPARSPQSTPPFVPRRPRKT